MKPILILIGILLFIIPQIICTAQQKDFPVFKGPYLGQKPPGTTPEIFAQEIISTKADEYALEISPSGNEILFRETVVWCLSQRRMTEHGTNQQ